MRDQGEKSGLTEWLWPTRLPDFAKAKPLGAALGGMIVLMGMALLAMIVVVFFDLFKIVFNPPAEPDLRGLGILLAGLIGAPFVFWRAIVAQQTVNIAEQNHITDQINKAVEGLGAEKTIKRNGEEETRPNLEVRIGAIYALERIARKNLSEHIQIMEILCAYIRQNAGREDVALPEGEATPEEWRAWSNEGREHPRLDVDVALKVIERRGAARKQLEKEKGYRPGLERAQLRKIILSERDLTGADLRFAELQGADLGFAQLQRANLRGAQLQGAHLWAAKFDENTNLSEATLRDASLRFVNCTNIPQLTEHLEGMFGDTTVILPGGHGPEHEDWPRHWPRSKLGFRQFEEEWKKWQAEPEGYVPPEPPEEGE